MTDRIEEEDGVLSAEFTAAERRKLRRMLQSSDRAVWLWVGAGIVAKWVITVGAAITAIKFGLTELLREVTPK